MLNGLCLLRDGRSYPFWFWKEDYVKKVVGDRGAQAPAVGAYIGAGSMQAGESSMQECDSRMKGVPGFDGSVFVKKEVELLGLCEEVVRLLKLLCFLGGCMLIAMLLGVFVQLLK